MVNSKALRMLKKIKQKNTSLVDSNKMEHKLKVDEKIEKTLRINCPPNIWTIKRVLKMFQKN